MRPLWRLWLVATVALGAFAAALVDFRQAAGEGCAPRGRPDPALTATIDPPPAKVITVYRLRVERAGEPVTGARVCLNVDMGHGGMSGMVVSRQADEVAPGSYQVEAYFPMKGRWGGEVLVVDAGRRPAAAPIRFVVR